MNCDLSFFLIHALISSLVCYCCDCFLGLFVELLVTHLSFQKYPNMAICRTYLFNFFRLSCARAHPAHSLIHSFAGSLSICFVYTVCLLSLNSFSIFCFVDVIYAVYYSFTLNSVRAHTPFKTSQRREKERRKKANDEQIFLRTIQITISVVVLGAFL